MQRAILEETRNELRREVSKRRSTLPPMTCLSWSRSIQAKVLELPQYLAASSIALYCAMRNEVETWAIMNHAFGQKKQVFCPKISGDRAPLFVQIFSEADLVSEPLVAAQPQGDVVLTPQDCKVALVIVPGVVFDVHGNRLGRGGGWYDRALAWFDNRGVFVGLAYELQVVDRVPVEPWDKKVHYVITESRVIDCGVMPHEQIAR
ncbi:MAG: 5-formyltetrahydrofolate cyclo-ligase [Candidatus Binatia bacterium]